MRLRKQLDFEIAGRIGGIICENQRRCAGRHHAAECSERLRQIRRGPDLINLAGHTRPVQKIWRRHARHRNPRRIDQRDAATAAGGTLDAGVVDRRDGRVKMRAKMIRHRE